MKTSLMDCSDSTTGMAGICEMMESKMTFAVPKEEHLHFCHVFPNSSC